MTKTFWSEAHYILRVERNELVLSFSGSKRIIKLRCSRSPTFPGLQVSEFPELVVLGVALEGFQGSFHRWLARLEPELATDSDDRCETSRRKVARGARPRKVPRTARPRTWFPEGFH